MGTYHFGVALEWCRESDPECLECICVRDDGTVVSAEVMRVENSIGSFVGDVLDGSREVCEVR